MEENDDWRERYGQIFKDIFYLLLLYLNDTGFYSVIAFAFVFIFDSDAACINHYYER